MRRSLIAVVLLGMLTVAVIALTRTSASAPRADVYWAEAQMHVKVIAIQPRANGAWQISYEMDVNGPEHTSLTVPGLGRPQVTPGDRALVYGKVAQTGDVLITSIAIDPLAGSPEDGPASPAAP